MAESAKRKDNSSPSNRQYDSSSDESSDEDMFGPTLAVEQPDDNEDTKSPEPVTNEPNQEEPITSPKHKKMRLSKHESRKRKVINEKVFLNNLPDFPAYKCSFMHRSQVTQVLTHQPFSLTGLDNSDFIITTSQDGRVMFWSKMKSSYSSSGDNKSAASTLGRVEFVKEFKAHNGSITKAALSYDGKFLATISSENEDKSVKIFDVVNFDMINFWELNEVPLSICWAKSKSTNSNQVLIVGFKNSKNIGIYDPDEDYGNEEEEEGESMKKKRKTKYKVIDNLHKAPVQLIAYNAIHDCIVSIDSLGMVEYWKLEAMNLSNYGASKEDLYSTPKGPGWFEMKSDTNLYDFRKTKNVPCSLTISPNGKYFTTFSLPDRKIRVFRFQTGKLIKEYDESLQKLIELKFQQNNENQEDWNSIDEETFEKILEREKTIETEHPDLLKYTNVIFDQSSNFIIFPSISGIKFVNIHSNKVVRILGQGEKHLRFLNLALYQGFNRSKHASKLSVEAAASENKIIQKSLMIDPILFATAFNTPRFYMFSKSPFTQEEEDDDDEEKEKESKPIEHNIEQWIKDSNRDVYNQKINKDNNNKNIINNSGKKSDDSLMSKLPDIVKNTKRIILHTTMGDIHVSFYPESAPLAVENFITLCKQGYYDNTIFHRIIKGFMIQGGDPDGDGTGGQSMWASTTGEPHFRDEFDSNLKHDRPYRLSMANAGPNTNGSQFFITTAPTPWLDNKHTIFGTVVFKDKDNSSVEVVKNIENLPTDKKDRPINDPPRIVSTSIID